MKVLVTGSSGHLGEALMRTLRSSPEYATGDLQVVSIDCLPSEFTSHLGSITDRAFVKECMEGVKVVYHLAALQKPHVATHTKEAFVEVNIKGTLNLLEEAVVAGVDAFIFTSTTSTFGDALVSSSMDVPTPWITENVTPIPKNIYGVTKIAAEDLCQLFHRNHKLNCIIMRTSRFFQGKDDDLKSTATYSDENLKVNELLYRRVDIADIVTALQLAAEKAKDLGFRKFIISGTSPFTQDDLLELRQDAPAVLRRYFPEYEAEYERRGWKMFPSLDRIYVNERARIELGWQPRVDYAYALACLRDDRSFRSVLGQQVGTKGYHRTAQDCLVSSSSPN